MPTAVEVLARIIQSEVGSSAPQAERLAVGWVARNRAAKRGQSIVEMAWPPAKQGKGRPFSSARAGTAASIAAARRVLLANASEDPTQGATSCFQPVLQDRMYSAGRYNYDANGVRRRWLAELDYYGSVGTWDLFGKKGGPGAKPIPPSWGLDKPSKGGPMARRSATKTAALGGFPWPFLLLFALASRRR